MAVSKKARFEVFKRDSFTCQYCGASAPSVVLECDHIHPRADGGSDSIFNLVTACHDCNSGKSDRKLSDQSVLLRQKAQLDELSERREQLEMLMQWREGLLDLNAERVDRVAAHWARLIENVTFLTISGKDALKAMIAKHGETAVLEAMETAVGVYARRGGDEIYTVESVEDAFDKLGGVLRITAMSKDQPYLRDLYYTRGILRRRLQYVNEADCMFLMKAACEAGMPPEDIKTAAIRCRSWSEFRRILKNWIEDAHG